MKSISLGDGSLQVWDKGSGLPILFVHGFPLSHAMWKPQLERFSEEYRTIAPDLRGFGGSRFSSSAQTSMEQFADDCANALTQLEISEPVVFCGLSMGGYIAWQFLQKYPEKVRALILCDTRAEADSPEGARLRRDMADKVQRLGSTESVTEGLLGKLFHPDSFSDQPEVIDFVRQMIHHTHPATFAAAQRGMSQRSSATAMLSGICVPTLLIVGAADAITTVEEMQNVGQQIPGAEILVVPRAGHMAPLENPAIVNSRIENFLAAL